MIWSVIVVITFAIAVRIYPIFIFLLKERIKPLVEALYDKILLLRNFFLIPSPAQNIHFRYFTLEIARPSGPKKIGPTCPMEWSWAGLFQPKIVAFFWSGPNPAGLQNIQILYASLIGVEIRSYTSVV
jgi:hypothetical protein